MASTSDIGERSDDLDTPFGPDEIRSFLERATRRKFGAFTLTRREVSSSSTDRSFWRADLEAEGGRFSFHVKCQPGRPGRDETMDRLMADNLEASQRPFPIYHGQFEARDHTIRVWDHCEGESRDSFQSFSQQELAAVIDAIVEVEAQSTEAFAAAGAPEGLRWIEPTAARLKTIEGELTALRLKQPLALWTAIEPTVIARLSRMGGRVLCHNDLKAPNVILTPEGGARIVDWDSAAIGPYGASLRVFSRSRTDADRFCAERYVEAHGRRGAELNVNDVMFVMHAQEAFWALDTGLAKRRISRVASGLRHVGRAFARSGVLKMTARPLPAPEPLKAAVREFMERNGGKLYMPIPHPDFEDWPSSRKPIRQDIIAPHLAGVGGTALDIGTHFGTFAHFLEDLGFDVTAVEVSEKYARIAEEIRDLTGKKFKVLHSTIFDIKQRDFDVVLALNIFHHFLKTESRFKALEKFLGELKAKVIIFQAHWNEEKQMEAAYRNFQQEEFVEFIAAKTGLTEITMIGAEKRRNLFKLTRPAGG